MTVVNNPPENVEEIDNTSEFTHEPWVKYNSIDATFYDHEDENLNYYLEYNEG